MGLLNNLFGKEQSKENPVVINITDDGISINGNEITLPTSLNELEEIFGKPTREYYEDNRWRIIWDDYGVSTDYVDWKHLPIVRVLIKNETRIKHLPKNTFKGIILINGKPIEEIPDDSITVAWHKINKGRYGGKEDNVFCYSLLKNYDYQEQDLSDKYTLKPVKNAIPFTDFNFKLAVIQELMYNQQLMKPRFDLNEFIENCVSRKIDMEKEGYEPIPEAIEYFRELEIDKELAEQVIEIYQDGGNEIYSNIIPYWDGEDNLFDIKSCEDLKHFPNLKKMTLFSAYPKLYEELTAKGIDARPL